MESVRKLKPKKNRIDFFINTPSFQGFGRVSITPVFLQKINCKVEKSTSICEGKNRVN